MNLYEQPEVKIVKNNTLGYIMSGLLIVSLGYTGYLYYSKDMVKKGDLKEKYIEKDNITFDTLPSYTKDRYVEKYKYESELSILNSKIKGLQSKTTSSIAKPQVVEKIIEVEKIVEVEKIIEIEKIVEVEKSSANKLSKIDKKSFNVYSCYDMSAGGVEPSLQCKKTLKEFLEKNKNSKLFEIIGVNNKKEFELIKKLRKTENKTRVDNLSHYAKLGISRKRVLEGAWAIREILGDDTNIQLVNYTVTSKKEDKGFILRAYK